MDSAALSRRLAELGLNVPVAAPGQPVVSPGSAEQAAELLGTCAREGWRVRLEGAGSRRVNTADADLVVSSRALTGFDIYEPDDLTVGVRAGTPHAAAAVRLADHQQLLPLDLPGSEAGTLGGAFASGEAGPLRAGYGTPRDLALGAILVTGDGRLLRLGGQVVKNVAGYDLLRLVVGSRGTLGFIAQLHLRLRSLPPSDVTVVAPLADGVAGAALALELRDRVGPVAVELLTPDGDHSAWRLALRLHGSQAATTDALDTVRRIIPGAMPLAASAAVAFWAALAAAQAGAACRLRLSAVPSALPTLLEAATIFTNSKSGKSFRGWRGAAHAADGGLRLWLPPGEDGLTDLSAEAAARFAEQLASVSGTCICERGPETLRAALPLPAASPRVLELERELRLRFDPARVLVGD